MIPLWEAAVILDVPVLAFVFLMSRSCGRTNRATLVVLEGIKSSLDELTEIIKHLSTERVP